MSYLDSLFSLAGKVAVVTGASRGLGSAIAQGLANAGAEVIGMARSSEPTFPLMERFRYQSCDVTDGQAFANLAAQVHAEHGRLDILVNAAAASFPTEGDAQSAENFARTLEVNLVAAYKCCLAASEQMKKSRSGAIINVTSINSVLGFPNNPGYVSSKGGLRMLTKGLAIDLAPHGIRVNAIAPGYFRTDMTQVSHSDVKVRQQRSDHTALGRWGEPEELAAAAIFLAADGARYVTGQDLFVDGGWTAMGLSRLS